MKCRLAFEGDLKPTEETAANRKGPVRDPFNIEQGRAPEPPPSPNVPLGPKGPQPAREEPKLGVGAFDEPPDWAKKPEIMPPPPDLHDAFTSGKLDVGGYQIGGAEPDRSQSSPPPSDAFIVMTGGSIHGGSTEVPGKKKSRKSKKRAAPPPARDTFEGMPPDLGPFGRVDAPAAGDVYAPTIQTAPTRKRRGGPKSKPGPSRARPGEDKPLKRRDPMAMAPPMSAPAAPPMPTPGMPPYAGPPPGEVPPLQGLDGPAVKRRVPQTAPPPPAAARAPGPARAKPSLPQIDWSFLSKARLITKPRAILGIIGGILAVFAVGYLLFGGNYFSSQAQVIAGGSQQAMAGLASYHLQAEVLMKTEKAGNLSCGVTADVARGKDLRVAYGATAVTPSSEFVSAGSKSFDKRGDGAWAASNDLTRPDLSSMALFAGASGIRVLDKQNMEGVDCDHLAFDSSPTFVRSLLPGIDVTASTRVRTEIWVDPQQKYLKHVRLDATNLETGRLGMIDCHVEATVSGYGAPVQVTAPI